MKDIHPLGRDLLKKKVLDVRNEAVDEKSHVSFAIKEPNVGCDYCNPTRISAQLFHEPNCPTLKKAALPGKAVNVEKIERVEPWPDPPEESLEDLEALEKKHLREKEDAFVNWMEEHYNGVSENIKEYRIGFYGGYDIGCIPIGTHMNDVDEYVGPLPPIKIKLPVPKMKPPKEEPVTPKGYGELKVGMEGVLNGVPVKIRKITKKDVILRPTNRAIRDEAGLMVSFKDKKKILGNRESDSHG